MFNRGTSNRDETMARQDEPMAQPREGVISIIGPGMRVVGDCETDGTLRIEGTVEGTVRAGKGVVVGKDGAVQGDILTQDAIIGGKVNGKIVAESRLELQSTCMVEGEVRARRVKLDEGGTINGTVVVGEVKATASGPKLAASSGGASATPAVPARA
ncbi:MAG: polymer-forming cytoskeletal protein [Gemmatimonadetes bacterium]|nr:polymer-forming cytoskeletal protein [Gemmatimonadota bacterium]